MSVSSLSFSANLPPFYQAYGYGTNFSQTNLSATGNLFVTSTNDPNAGKQTTVSSSVTANGINYLATNSSAVGNLLTVFYQTPGDAQTPGDNKTSPSTININGAGIQFDAQKSTTTDSGTATVYDTDPNAALGYKVSDAATSSGSSDNGQNYVLKSLSVVGGSLVATYEVTSGDLPNNVQLAHAQAPVSEAPLKAPTITNSSGTNTVNFQSKPISTIGELLAGSSGVTANGTVTGAIQSGVPNQSLGIAHANSVLAASLDPNINLNSGTQLSVSDFIDTSLNAFPTINSQSAEQDAKSADDFTNGNSNQNDFISNNHNPFDQSQTDTGVNATPSGHSSQSFGTSFGNNSPSTSVYNSISAASASTIRGSSLNTVA